MSPKASTRLKAQGSAVPFEFTVRTPHPGPTSDVVKRQACGKRRNPHNLNRKFFLKNPRITFPTCHTKNSPKTNVPETGRSAARSPAARPRTPNRINRGRSEAANEQSTEQPNNRTTGEVTRCPPVPSSFVP